MKLWSYRFSQNMNQQFCPVVWHSTVQKSFQYLVHILGGNNGFVNSFWNLLTFNKGVLWYFKFGGGKFCSVLALKSLFFVICVLTHSFLLFFHRNDKKKMELLRIALNTVYHKKWQMAPDYDTFKEKFQKRQAASTYHHKQ